MLEYIQIDTTSFKKLLEAVHQCHSESKLSYNIGTNYINLECCKISLDGNDFKMSITSNATKSQDSEVNLYEEVIHISEDHNSFDGIYDFDCFVNINETNKESPQTPTSEIESDPLTLNESFTSALTSNKQKKNRDVLKSKKLINWDSESIECINSSDNISKRFKYPTSLVCEYCGQKFVGKNRIYKLFYHRNKLHLRQTEFKCIECNKIFWGERELSMHASTHIDDCFICEVCGIKFSRKSDLVRHGLTHNYDKKLFACRFCSKKFCRKDNLNVHERVHTGNFPYLCKKCGSGFAQNRQLKLHWKKCPFSNHERKNSVAKDFTV